MDQRPQPPPGASAALKLALTAAAALPLAFVGARALGLVGYELRWVAVGAAPVLALVSLLVFEPPRSWSARGWLRQLRRRLAPAPRAEPGPPPASARRERRRAVAPPPPAALAPPAPSEPLVVVDPGAGPEALRATEEYLPRPVDRAPPYPEVRLASLGASGELVPMLETPPAPEEATHRLLPMVTPQPVQAVPVPPAPLVDAATVRQLPPLEGPPPPAVAPVSLKQALEAARARPPRAEPYRKAYEAEAGAAPTRSLPTAKPEAPAVQVPVAPAGKRRPSG